MKEEFKIIADSIEREKSILDVGCGDGELMKFIYENISKKIRGLEISKDNVQKCIKKGLTVIEGNAEMDLQQFPSNSFDYVILSQTLQAFLNPEKVISDLLRIGKTSIVTIPNFGFWKVRFNFSNDFISGPDSLGSITSASLLLCTIYEKLSFKHFIISTFIIFLLKKYQVQKLNF